MAVTVAEAQTLGERVKRKVNDRVNRRVDETIDKGLNKTEEEIDKAGKNATKKDEKKTTDKKSSSAKADTTSPGGGKAFSDFIPGSKVIFAENFEKDALSDFPAGWNTTGSGAVVNLDGKNGKWLSIAHNSVVHPVLQKPLPENCTIEFVLFLQSPGGGHSPSVHVGLTPVKYVLREERF